MIKIFTPIQESADLGRSKCGGEMEVPLRSFGGGYIQQESRLLPRELLERLKKTGLPKARVALLAREEPTQKELPYGSSVRVKNPYEFPKIDVAEGRGLYHASAPVVIKVGPDADKIREEVTIELLCGLVGMMNQEITALREKIAKTISIWEENKKAREREQEA